MGGVMARRVLSDTEIEDCAGRYAGIHDPPSAGLRGYRYFGDMLDWLGEGVTGSEPGRLSYFLRDAYYDISDISKGNQSAGPEAVRLYNRALSLAACGHVAHVEAESLRRSVSLWVPSDGQSTRDDLIRAQRAAEEKAGALRAAAIAAADECMTWPVVKPAAGWGSPIGSERPRVRV